MENTNKSYFFHTDQLTVGYDGQAADQRDQYSAE